MCNFEGFHALQRVKGFCIVPEIYPGLFLSFGEEHFESHSSYGSSPIYVPGLSVL